MFGVLDDKPTVEVKAKAVRVIEELSDGSLVTSAADGVKRWVISRDGDGKEKLAQIGTFNCPPDEVLSAVQKDDNTLIFGVYPAVLQLWNINTYQCVETLPTSSGVARMVKTKNQSKIILSLLDGTIEMRRTSDLQPIWKKASTGSTVECICELHDGSFVTTSYANFFVRWSEEGQVLHIFTGHTDLVHQVVESKPGTIVSSSNSVLHMNKTIKIWNVSSQECLHTISSTSGAMVSIDKGIFAVAHHHVSVWNDEGEHIETIRTLGSITNLKRLRDGSIVIVTTEQIQIRKW